MLYHGEHGRLQGTQGTHKYILTILCLVLGHIISWRTWTPTRTQGTHKYILTILCLVLGHVIHGEHDAYKELKAHTSTLHIYYLVFCARPCYIMENMDTYKELKAHTSIY